MDGAKELPQEHHTTAKDDKTSLTSVQVIGWNPKLGAIVFLAFRCQRWFRQRCLDEGWLEMGDRSLRRLARWKREFGDQYTDSCGRQLFRLAFRAADIERYTTSRQSSDQDGPSVNCSVIGKSNAQVIKSPGAVDEQSKHDQRSKPLERLSHEQSSGNRGDTVGRCYSQPASCRCAWLWRGSRRRCVPRFG